MKKKKGYQDIIVISAHVVNYIISLVLAKTLIKVIYSYRCRKKLMLTRVKNGEG